jgi:hypothetical protein
MRPPVTSRSSVTTTRAANLVENEEGIREREKVQPAPVGSANRCRRRRAAGFRDVARTAV